MVGLPSKGIGLGQAAPRVTKQVAAFPQASRPSGHRKGLGTAFLGTQVQQAHLTALQQPRLRRPQQLLDRQRRTI